MQAGVNKMEKETKQTGPRVLPIVVYKGKQFFADLRLNEFRPVSDFESIRFDSEEGWAMCQNTGVVVCQSCGMSVIISKFYEDQPLHCMQCFGREFLPLSDD